MYIYMYMYLYTHRVDERNPAPVENGSFSLFLGFQPSFWWRRISQPSTVSYYVCNANYHKETIRKPFETFG
jgi:hypothetical protein